MYSVFFLSLYDSGKHFSLFELTTALFYTKLHIVLGILGAGLGYFSVVFCHFFFLFSTFAP